MTVYETFRQRALLEFDQMVETRGQQIRASMAAAGCSPRQIARYLKRCEASLAVQRKKIGHTVMIELAKAGAPLETPANDNN